MKTSRQFMFKDASEFAAALDEAGIPYKRGRDEAFDMETLAVATLRDHEAARRVIEPLLPPEPVR